jgi:LPXTG-motif cell wall-anchored protein
MLKKATFATFVVLLILSLTFLTRPVSADPQPQVGYQTPTAYPDGRVIYIVQPNDTCLRIELLTGVKVEQLRTLNKLDQNCTLSVGKELLLAILTAVPTTAPNPAVTPTPLLPTPTAFAGNGEICVQLYDDTNGNAFHEESEPLINGGAVSISDRLGKTSETGLTTTDPENLFCKEIPQGEYNISMAVPDGYNATNETTVNVPVQAGDQVYVDFGAQVSSRAAENQPAAVVEPSTGGSTSLMLAIVGGLLLLLGVGLGVYVLFMRRG